VSYGVLLHGIVMFPTTSLGLIFLPMLGTSRQRITLIPKQNATFDIDQASNDG